MRLCLQCSASLAGRRADAKWCSVRCRTYWVRAQRQAEARSGRLCAECRHVIPGDRKLNAKTCSEACHRARNNRRRGYCPECRTYFRQPKTSRRIYCGLPCRMKAWVRSIGGWPYKPAEQVEPLPIPYVGHEVFAQAEKVAGRPDWVWDWGQYDAMGEAVLAILEGRDPDKAVRKYRAAERAHDVRRARLIADVGMDESGNIYSVKDYSNE